MTSLPLAFRRLAIIAGVVAVMALGVASIRAAGNWTAAAAPLSVAPVSVDTLQSKLDTESARSEALSADLAALEKQIEELTGAVGAAQGQLDADGTTATDLQAKLTASQERLTKLQALIAKAERQLRAAAAARAPAAAPAAPASTGGEPGGDDDD